MTRNLVGTVAIAVLGLCLGGEARAQSLGWQLCIPGTFRSCHSIQITTAPRFDPMNVRDGTIITFRLANLQGTHPLDNTAWSRLSNVNFRGPNGPTGVADNSFINGVTSGAATGPTSPNNWGYFAQPNVGYPSAGIATLIGYAGIGGCSPVAAVPGTFDVDFTTCGGFVTFSISSNAILDATDLNAALITVDGPNGATYRCVTDQVLFPTGRNTIPTCSDQVVLGDTVVPEPVTIALLGTGLLGVGAARARRRRTEHDA